MWITVTGGATARRVAWWLLLTCTVIGLASMHTLGHGRVAGPSLHPGGGSSPHVPSGSVAGSSSPLPAGSSSYVPVSSSHLPVGSAAGSFSHPLVGSVAGSFSYPLVGWVAGSFSRPSLLSHRSVISFGLAPAGLRSGGLRAGPHPDDRESGGGHGAAWGVCLAVLVALTVAVLLSAWLLLRRRDGRHGNPRAFSAGWVISRGPPRRGAGLQLASVSVMRI